MDGVENDRAINWLHRLTYGQYESPGEGRTVVLDWVIFIPRGSWRSLDTFLLSQLQRWGLLLVSGG